MILLLALLACGPRPPQAPEAPAATEPVLPARWAGPALVADVSVVAVGDLLMHTNVQRSAAAAAAQGIPHDGFPALFEHIRHRVGAADVAFANLETPVAPDANQGTRAFVFNVGAALLPALSDVGFDVLSFANNHVYDQGRAGFVETLDRLEASDMAFVGAGRTCAEAQAPRFTEVDGITLAWLGASKVYNSRLNAGPDDPCAAEFHVDTALEQVRAARAQGADAVIYSVHWGREYQHAPDPAEVEDARALAEGGVDVVLGHHPHVIQPVEVVHTADGRTAVIAYSLGNFISNQTYAWRHGVNTPASGAPRDGLMLSFDVVRKDYGPGPDGQPQLVTGLANVQAIPLWTDNDARRVVEPAPTIRVVAVPDALDAAYQALESAEGDARLAALQRIELLRSRWQVVEDLLEDVVLPPRPR